MIQRLQRVLLTNAFFLFGARGTGKSTYLRTLFGADRALWLDLLGPEQEARYGLRPAELQEQINASPGRYDWVVIDEIQKVRPGRNVALVEIKSAERVDERDTRGLSRFRPDFPGADAFRLSRDKIRKRIGSVLAVPWEEGLAELGL